MAVWNSDNFFDSKKTNKFSSNGTTNKGVDDEVDSRVNDGSEVSNMSETTNDHVGSEICAMVHAFKDIVNMEKLKDVHSDSRSVKNKKSDHNTEKNKKEVDFFLEHFL